MVVNDGKSSLIVDYNLDITWLEIYLYIERTTELAMCRFPSLLTTIYLV